MGIFTTYLTIDGKSYRANFENYNEPNEIDYYTLTVEANPILTGTFQKKENGWSYNLMPYRQMGDRQGMHGSPIIPIWNMPYDVAEQALLKLIEQFPEHPSSRDL